MSCMASGGPGKSNGSDGNSPNDERERDRKRQEAYDELRRREEGMLIEKFLRIQKDFFFVCLKN